MIINWIILWLNTLFGLDILLGSLQKLLEGYCGTVPIETKLLQQSLDVRHWEFKANVSENLLNLGRGHVISEADTMELSRINSLKYFLSHQGDLI
jgi:hypothetical protein